MVKKEININKINKKEDVNLLKKKISYLEEEISRKQEQIDKLKKENLILFKTAVKRSEDKLNAESSENKTNSSEK